MKKPLIRLISISIAAIILATGILGCINSDPNNPVILTAGNFQMCDFDFMLAFTSDEYYNYYIYGAQTPQEYFERILSTVTDRAVALNYAKKNKIELSESELTDIDNQLAERFKLVEENYCSQVDESITDEQAILSEAYKLLENDLGYDVDSYKSYLKTSMINSAIIEKLRNNIADQIELSEADVKLHISDIMLKYKNTTSFTDFQEKYNQFLNGKDSEPYLVNEDCFTVGQLLLKFEDGDETAAHNTEETIDGILSQGFIEDGFYDLIAEYGQDENMKKDRYIDWGYLVHDSLTPSYPEGFVHAAYNLRGETNPGFGMDTVELVSFTSSDGKKVIKFTSTDGIHYLILNRVFPRGEIKYEEGDDIWNMAYQAAFARTVDAEYQESLAEWKEKTKVTYYFDSFRDKYEVPPEEFNGLVPIS